MPRTDLVYDCKESTFQFQMTIIKQFDISNWIATIEDTVDCYVPPATGFTSPKSQSLGTTSVHLTNNET